MVFGLHKFMGVPFLPAEGKQKITESRHSDKQKSRPPCDRDFWSWWPDSNRRPVDYESTALPTEPHQHIKRYLLYHFSPALSRGFFRFFIFSFEYFCFFRLCRPFFKKSFFFSENRLIFLKTSCIIEASKGLPFCRYSLVAEHQLPKLVVTVRFRLPAPDPIADATGSFFFRFYCSPFAFPYLLFPPHSLANTRRRISKGTTVAARAITRKRSRAASGSVRKSAPP